MLPLPPDFPALAIAGRTVVPIPPRRVRVEGRPATAPPLDGTGILPVTALYHLPSGADPEITGKGWVERVYGEEKSALPPLQNWVNRICRLLGAERGEIFDRFGPKFHLKVPLVRLGPGAGEEAPGFEVQVGLGEAGAPWSAVWVSPDESAGSVAERVLVRLGYDKPISLGRLYAAKARATLLKGEVALADGAALAAQGVRAGDALTVRLSFEQTYTGPSDVPRTRAGDDPALELHQALLREAYARLATPGWIED